MQVHFIGYYNMDIPSNVALGFVYIRAKAKATSLPSSSIVSMLVFILERFPSESESDITFAF